MRATRLGGLILGGVCIFCMILLFGPGRADAKGPARSRGGPKKPPAAAKSSPRAKPAAKSPPKTKRGVKPAKTRRPLSRPPLARKASPRKRPPTRGTSNDLLPPVYLGQTPSYLRPRLVVPRVIHSTSKHVSIVNSTEASNNAAQVPVSEGRPDLGVIRIQADYDDRNDLTEKQLLVTATLKNLGGAAFRSDEGAQVLVLYKNGKLVGQRDFDTLEIGQALKLTVEAEPEPVVYEARVLFADELRDDGNPANDDMNPRNNALVRKLDLTEPPIAEPPTEAIGTVD